uniref:Transposase n=1 Tax=Hydatigena taeniaeformis TaxID=6205 RepID=A0A0R3WU67_HYDTA
LEEQMAVIDYLFDESRRNLIMERTKSLQSDPITTSREPVDAV